MTVREWVLPLALGALAAGLVFVLPSPEPAHDDALPGPAEEPLGLAWAFDRAATPPGLDAVLLAVGTPDARELEVACPDGPRTLPLTDLAGPLWRLDLPPGCLTPDGALRNDASRDPVVFGRDGRNATVVTVNVFNEDGELVASSDGATRRNRYRLYGDFVTLSDTPWYLGDGPVPDGMRSPEGYVDFARQHLVGLPEGAVATAYLETHEYDWLTGPLWVTVRVDAVLPAP